jgi:tetratricopeptide (TPR) repeat protein
MYIRNRFVLVRCLVLAGMLMLGYSYAHAQQPCPPWPTVNGDGIGPFDYRDGSKRNWLANVNANHFNNDVRSLRKGQSSAHIAGDLHFILHRFPNHPGALEAMIRLGERQKRAKPSGAIETVECYIYRAALFAPGDVNVRALYGLYLSKAGKRKQALEQLVAANKLAPDSRNIHYNLGLLYFDEKDYDKAKEHAKRAYDLGFPLEGLKKKLQSVGAWEG